MEKTKLFKTFQPYKQLLHGKLKKTQLREATNCWLYPWTNPVFRCQTQLSGRWFHIRTWEGRKDLANWDVLYLDISNSHGWAAAAARVLRTLVEADESSLNRQWLEFELTLYYVLSPATRRRSMTQWQETPIGTKPGHRIHLAIKTLKVTFNSWPHTREQYWRIGRTNGSFRVMWTNFRKHPHFTISDFDEILPVASTIFQIQIQIQMRFIKKWNLHRT